MQTNEFFKTYKTSIFILIFLIAAFAIYAKTIKYDFVYFDDTALVVENCDYISDYKNIPGFFYASAFNTANDFYYRPLLTLSFSLDSMISAKSPAISHFTNILLHFISSLLLFILLRRLKFNEIFSFLFTVIFIVHPSFVQAVAWIPGRNDTLLMVFIIAALILIYDYFDPQKRQVYKIIIAAFAFLAALMTKETASVLFILIPLFMYVFCLEVKKKDYITVLVVMFVMLIAYLLLRAYAVGEAQKVFTLGDYIAKTLHSLKAYIGYIEYALMPLRISLIPEKMPFDIFTLISAVLFVVPIIMSLFFGVGRKKVILFGLLWFTLLILPTLGVSINYWFSHRIYTASFGILLIFIEFFISVSEKMQSYTKYLQLFLFLPIILFFTVSFVQAEKFQNRKIFLANAVSEQPDSDMVKIQIARHYVDIGNPLEALETLKKVHPKENEKYTLSYYESLGMVLFILGNYEEAKEIFLMVLSFYDDREYANFMLSEICFRQGEYDQSLKYIKKLLFINSGKKQYPGKEKYENQYNKILNKIESI